MCGFAGFISSEQTRDTLERQASAMANAIRHRGPDSHGVWSDAEAGLALAHCRLAIIDVSPAGHQPMLSHTGRYCIAFNGEIYNFAELKRDLEAAGKAPPWRGTSDTEVLLASIESIGIMATVEKAVGMFAFALWDRKARRLTLVRDRLGEKPLYYGQCGDSFVFASDLAALRRHPAWTGNINRDALSLLLAYGYIPAPHAIYQGIAKLEPGTILEYASDETNLTHYWTAEGAARRAALHPFEGTAEDAVATAGRLVMQSVSGQMIADVPLGAFLSGGIDSSLVVATMQSLSPRPIKTFTIGFSEAGYDEARNATAIARHLGTDHTTHYVTAQDALDTVPKLAQIYSEPFADASQIPTYLISKLACQDVTVALSGDGGDEVFSGYDRYAIADRYWPKIARLPIAARRTLADALKRMPPTAWDGISQLPIGSKAFGRGRLSERAHKFADILASANPEEAYQLLISKWQNPSTIVKGASDLPPVVLAGPETFSFVERMMLSDIAGYLPGDILTKVDRAAMAVSLETRVPLLDHRLIEFSMSLPTAIQRRNGRSKWIAQELLARHVPRSLFERPKMGFTVPLGEWLRGPLKSWAEDLLAAKRLDDEGYFFSEPIRRAWTEHQQGRGNNTYSLWCILMFQAWLENEKNASKSDNLS